MNFPKEATLLLEKMVLHVQFCKVAYEYAARHPKSFVMASRKSFRDDENLTNHSGTKWNSQTIKILQENSGNFSFVHRICHEFAIRHPKSFVMTVSSCKGV